MTALVEVNCENDEVAHKQSSCEYRKKAIFQFVLNHFLIPKSWASQVLHQHCAASKSLFANLFCVECTYMFLLLGCMNLEWVCVLFVGSY